MSVGKETFKKYVCDAPYRAGRSMSNYYFGTYSKTLDCSYLTDSQKAEFNGYQNLVNSVCQDSFRCTVNRPSQSTPSQSSNPFDNFNGGRKKRIRGGASCSAKRY
jgi:hypothetical protein